MMMSPGQVLKARRAGEDGPVEQTLTLGQLLVNGLLRRLTLARRRVTDIKLVELLRTRLLTVRIDPCAPSLVQIRFCSSA